MGTVKRTLANVSFYDQRAIESKLEEMAAKGWMLTKAGSLFWTYRRIPPRKLRFAVTYFPGASELDPQPSERQLDKEDFCARDGWHLILRWDAMMIFCTDRADAVPIETDPLPQVDNIHRTMKKKVLTGQLTTIAMVLLSLYLQLSQLWRDPVDYLSSTGRLCFIPFWLLLLLLAVCELVFYFRWQRRARQAAENGVFLPVRSRKYFPWVVVIPALLLLLFSFSGSGSSLLFTAAFAAVMAAALFLSRTLMGALKKHGVSRTVNLAVSSICITAMVLAGTIGLVAAGINGWLPTGSASQPVDRYEWRGHLRDIYDDPLPLEVEDLSDVEARWSKKASRQESPLLAYGQYEQDLLFGQDVQGCDLSYKITDVKVPALYGFIKDRLLRERQDEIHDGVVFEDHFEPADPTPWGAGEVYQLHWSDSILDTYLVCWENRIVEITFYWPPTQAQIRAAAEQLHP